MPDETALPPEILAVIRSALSEDIGPGDVTTNSIIPPEAVMRGQIIAKQEGVIAGLDVAQAVYQELDPRVDFTPQVGEGTRVVNRLVLALIAGRARSLLTAERTALNFLGRISGIATLTRAFVDAVAGQKPSSWTRARPPRDCGWWINWPSNAAAVRTTASGCTIWC